MFGGDVEGWGAQTALSRGELGEEEEAEEELGFPCAAKFPGQARVS